MVENSFLYIDILNTTGLPLCTDFNSYYLDGEPYFGFGKRYEMNERGFAGDSLTGGKLVTDL